MDHKEAEGIVMRYLAQPRGPGTGWVFRMVTPLALVGVPNPWDGKPLAKEIKRGLGTRYLVEARKRRDMLLGDVRKLELHLCDGASFAIAAAMEWRADIASARVDGLDTAASDEKELVLSEFLQRAEDKGQPLGKLQRFARVATGRGFPLDTAIVEYLHARRSGNPAGNDPLKQTTIMALGAAVVHLRGFLGDENKTACLEDVTPKLARQFRDEYLPSAKSNRAPNGLARQTIAKNINLLRQVWVWAIENDQLKQGTPNPWMFQKGIDQPKVSSTVDTGVAQLKVRLPGVKFRTVIDRGVAYPYPLKYSHPVLKRLVESGEIKLDADGRLSLVGMLRIAIEHLAVVIAEAEALKD